LFDWHPIADVVEKRMIMPSWQTDFIRGVHHFSGARGDEMIRALNDSRVR